MWALHVSTFLFSFLAITNGAAMDEFCRQQEETYQASAGQVRKVLIQTGTREDADIPAICRAMVNYINTAFDTDTLCPGNGGPASAAMENNIHHLITNICQDSHPSQQCSLDVVNRVTSKCAEIVNNVEVDSSSELLCRTSREYLHCLENVLSSCAGSSSLLQANVFMAISSMRGHKLGACGVNPADAMQGDQPAGGDLTPSFPAGPTGCTEDMVNGEMETCVEAYTASEWNGNANCRAKHAFLGCIERVRANCPGPTVPNSVGIILRTVQNSNCDGAYLQCPSEVLNRSNSVHSYCLNRIGNIEQNAANYCRKIGELARCMSNLRDVCPMTSESDRQQLDQTAAGIDEGLRRFC